MTGSGAFNRLAAMMAIEKSPQGSDYRYVEVNGTDLAYVERGHGRPVIFVHGGISDLTIWEPILDRIGEQRRAIAHSRRWAWPNEPIPAGVADSVDRHAVDLAALIEKLQLGRVDLVGNSFGGFISLVVARDRPDLVRRLVVQEPPVFPLLVGFPPSPLALLKLVVTRPRIGLPLARMVFGGIAPTEAAVKRGDVEASIERFARQVALGEAGYERLPAWVKEHMRLNAGTHASQFGNNGGFVRFTPADARSIKTPTLVMTGEQSPAGLRAIAGELARLLPNAQTVDIPGASHVMHLDNPQATVRAIEDFLGDN